MKECVNYSNIHSIFLKYPQFCHLLDLNTDLLLICFPLACKKDFYFEENFKRQYNLCRADSKIIFFMA